MIFVIQFYEIALNFTLLDDNVKNLDLKKDSVKYRPELGGHRFHAMAVAWTWTPVSI